MGVSRRECKSTDYDSRRTLDPGSDRGSIPLSSTSPKARYTVFWGFCIVLYLGSKLGSEYGYKNLERVKPYEKGSVCFRTEAMYYIP